jgi:serine/threonine-protein kinase
VAVAETGVVLAGRYRLRDRVGSGGAGEVWRAVDAVLGRTVAVKLPRPQYAGDAETLARFAAEAQHAAMVAHPGIVQVYDYGRDGRSGGQFLVMELVNGPSLAAAMGGGPLEPSWVLDMIGQVAAGLAAAHAAGLVHRDIKPANLLLAPGGAVKITDFGIAHAAGSARLTRAGTLRGTPGYLAPERVAGGAASPASDLYSLGVVAWECLAGAPPFTGSPLEVASAHARRPLPPLPPQVPAEVAALVAQLTAKDPAGRPASAAATAARARQLRGAETATAAAAAIAPGSRPAGRYARPPATLALTAIAARGTPPPTRRRRHGRPGRAATLAVAAGAATAAQAGWLITTTPGSAPPSRLAGTQTAGPTAPAAPMVTVDEAALAGQPADRVLRQLRQAGLRPALAQMPDGRLPPGTVISVQPAGQVPAGSAVTVTAASASSGHRHGHGHGGDQNGG